MTVTFKAEPNKYLHILIYILSILAARPLLVNFPNETYFKFELKRMRPMLHTRQSPTEILISAVQFLDPIFFLRGAHKQREIVSSPVYLG